jgi:hypothetical protein
VYAFELFKTVVSALSVPVALVEFVLFVCPDFLDPAVGPVVIMCSLPVNRASGSAAVT